MDEDGRKMSKSLGNVVVPQDVMKQSGADILRLWVMTTDYWEDQRLGKNVLQTNIDAYRKLRNTMRWMLGTLAHDDGATVPLSDMPELERLMLHRLSELDQVVRNGQAATSVNQPLPLPQGVSALAVGAAVPSTPEPHWALALALTLLLAVAALWHRSLAEAGHR